MIIAVSIDTPGYRPGLNVAAAMSGVARAGLPTGRFIVDLGYSQQLAENYALPMIALGYELMHMFDVAEYGKIQANFGGLICVEGCVYGPCLPLELRNATLDYHNKVIDKETFEQRIEARKAYMARRKDRKDGTSVWVFRCPGCGPHRTVRCDLKPVPRSQEAAEAAKRKQLPLIHTPPAEPPTCCTNKASISAPVEVFVRYVTALPFKTPEWSRQYALHRNAIEGRNRYAKNPLDANLAAAGERRFRGIGKQSWAIVTKLVSVNIQTIRAWIDRQDRLDGPSPKKRSGRKPAPSIQERYLPDPTGPPARIIGPAA